MSDADLTSRVQGHPEPYCCHLATLFFIVSSDAEKRIYPVFWQGFFCAVGSKL